MWNDNIKGRKFVALHTCLLVLFSGSEAPRDVKFKGNIGLGTDVWDVREKASLVEITMNNRYRNKHYVGRWGVRVLELDREDGSSARKGRHSRIRTQSLTLE